MQDREEGHSLLRGLRKILFDVGSNRRLLQRLLKTLPNSLFAQSGQKGDVLVKDLAALSGVIEEILRHRNYVDIDEKIVRPAKAEALLTQLLEEEDNLLISDMGASELFDLRALRGSSDLHELPFEHELDIPVGLGFSLCIVPYFLQHPCDLRNLAREVGEFASSQGGSFRRYGVAVDWDNYGQLVKSVRAKPGPADRGRDELTVQLEGLCDEVGKQKDGLSKAFAANVKMLKDRASWSMEDCDALASALREESGRYDDPRANKVAAVNKHCKVVAKRSKGVG